MCELDFSSFKIEQDQCDETSTGIDFAGHGYATYRPGASQWRTGENDVFKAPPPDSMVLSLCPGFFVRNDHEFLPLLSNIRATEVPEYIISWFCTSLYFHTRHYHLLLLPKFVHT